MPFADFAIGILRFRCHLQNLQYPSEASDGTCRDLQCPSYASDATCRNKHRHLKLQTTPAETNIGILSLGCLLQKLQRPKTASQSQSCPFQHCQTPQRLLFLGKVGIYPKKSPFSPANSSRESPGDFLDCRTDTGIKISGGREIYPGLPRRYTKRPLFTLLPAGRSPLDLFAIAKEFAGQGVRGFVGEPDNSVSAFFHGQLGVFSSHVGANPTG